MAEVLRWFLCLQQEIYTGITQGIFKDHREGELRII
jgi:hypothetical protein